MRDWETHFLKYVFKFRNYQKHLTHVNVVDGPRTASSVSVNLNATMSEMSIPYALCDVCPNLTDTELNLKPETPTTSDVLFYLKGTPHITVESTASIVEAHVYSSGVTLNLRCIKR